MVDVTAQRAVFVQGLTERGGWTAGAAASHFDRYASLYQIGDAIRFVCDEAVRLRRLYPAILIAPLLYDVETDRLAQIEERSVRDA